MSDLSRRRDLHGGRDALAVRIHRLHLCTTHPDPALPWADGDTEVYAYLIEHPDGLILVDTGVGTGNELINALYRPEHHDLGEAIAGTGHRLDEVAVVVNSHLHFDHCGNNRLFPGVPVLVQRREYEAAHQPHYTDPSWVDFPGATITRLDGDHAVAAGVCIISTPGHTPGHQSVLVEADDGPTLLVSQASYAAADFEAAEVGERNTPTEDEHTWRGSLRRLYETRPHRACFSHDATEWQQPVR
jgi:N-acyl homoserine lactone hydrolase